MQGAHGFITQHQWRHSIRAAVNLEGAGAGGRELLFQAGVFTRPGNAWLIETYMQYAPHAHCSILAQEIFQSGIMPSDTDYRVFRDYGRVPGLDIAYVRNGYVYHTEFDQTHFISTGTIQRAGENALSVVTALANSPHLSQPGDYHSAQLIFFDVWGVFTVIYSQRVGTVLNLLTCLSVFIMIGRNVWPRGRRERVFDTKASVVVGRQASTQFYARLFTLIPVVTMVCYGVFLMTEIFLPVMGRAGKGHVDPEIFVVVIAFLAVLALSLFTHTTREIFSESDQLVSNENALWYQTLDARGGRDLPEHALTSATREPQCEQTPNEYCDLPYYGPTKDAFLIATRPHIIPFHARQQLDDRKMVLVSRHRVSTITANTFRVRRQRRTQANTVVILRNARSSKDLVKNARTPELQTQNTDARTQNNEKQLHLAIVGHYTHEATLKSPILAQTVELIKTRRQQPHVSLGWWRWAITAIAGNAQVIVKWF
ncbi:unnamed protein product [Sphagnum balticum]